MPVSIWLAFFTGYDFQGLWLGLLAAQGSCAVTMLVVLCRTDWEFEAKRAKKLTGMGAASSVDHNHEVDPEKPLKHESKEDSLLLAGSDENEQ
ncbi:Multidrug and toxin extrusion protein 1 [Spatholobus suberectus]|nr:Multidrug and toxin extrusion protein 1 [Spatholobus suberectus]